MSVTERDIDEMERLAKRLLELCSKAKAPPLPLDKALSLEPTAEDFAELHTKRHRRALKHGKKA